MSRNHSKNLSLTFFVPANPPDLDCGEIQYRNFKVLPPDPHRFDGDKDGIGCGK